ncbi:enoyl-CoA hydratase/isomerase family protein [Dactylosporangium aurantiacum]|uniref:Enoyl-CoA hydratase/isomerase family protein n=1 Tax=Dactylosporangium aurantiacum TaxID=35754 RepID=A0A9Q9IR03_9ACTN|nr:enoyl-CoA hydratase/isomerase family protein [Dactylosporangium aurantiacum]MDG6106262.1 enoyl-CoA hydratase/isomerase family protein [Dactylosporangium aurantiacum]UWZ58237.1 enoyl-CoA hydratase/isomerase family protein [Dactylosporangium aurantiacum]
MAITLTSEHDGRIARVRYDNAARGNCFDDAALTELVATMETAAANAACAVIRLDMAGRHFCGGWDTTSFAALAGTTQEAVADGLRASDAALRRIRQLPVPVVSAVRGQVIGFGAGLLDAIHLPVAAADARLSLPEARFGFAPAGVGYAIARALPRPHAYALVTGASTATATQLLGWGLVARVVADDDLDGEVDALVEALAAVPPHTLRAVVEVVESSLATGSPEHAYDISARTIVAGVTA